MAAKKTYTELEVTAALNLIKNQDSIIKQAFELYKKKYPNHSYDGIVELIAEESGISRATVWRKLGSNTRADRIIII